MLSKEWARLVPVGGIVVHQDVLYKDANDVHLEERNQVKKLFYEDREYMSLIGVGLPRYTTMGLNKQFAVYIYNHGDDLVGLIVGYELLKNPDGYGKDDYFYAKLVHPKYRRSKYSRHMESAFFYMIFFSGVAKRLYTYAPYTGDDTNLLTMMDLKRMPCSSAGLGCTGWGTKFCDFMSIPKKVQVYGKPHVILQLDGDMYRGLEEKDFIEAAPDKDPQVIRDWLKDVNKGSTAIREIQK